MVFTLNHLAVLIRLLPHQRTKNNEQTSMLFFTAIVVIARATLALGGEIQFQANANTTASTGVSNRVGYGWHDRADIEW